MKYALVFGYNWEAISLVRIRNEKLLQDKVKLLLFLEKRMPWDKTLADVHDIYIFNPPLNHIDGMKIDKLCDDPRIRDRK